VHVVAADEGSPPRIDRDDDHVWAAAVRATGGLAWSASAGPAPDESKARSEVFEELARPLRIDKIRYEMPNLSLEDLAPPETLVEGQGFEDLRISDKPVGWVRADGELWSSPVQTVLVWNAAENKLWSALAFGSSVASDLSEAEEMVLAKRGGAVSPVTSYVSATPGARPPFEPMLSGGSSCGVGIGRSARGSSHCGGLPARDNLDDLLGTMLKPRFAACGGGAKHAEIDLETTRREVVDVTRADVEGAGGDVARCLEQAVWDLDLPSEFARYTFRTFSLTL
jgi:hypothetical protein